MSATPQVPSRWTSLDLLACERRLVEVALTGRGSGAGRVRAEAVMAVLDRCPHLSGEQVAMVAGLCRSGHGVEVVIGAAGSGKTSALAAAREAWQSDGYAVVGCALAARAAEQLQEGAGIASSTLPPPRRSRLRPAAARVRIDRRGRRGRHGRQPTARTVGAAHDLGWGEARAGRPSCRPSRPAAHWRGWLAGSGAAS